MTSVAWRTATIGSSGAPDGFLFDFPGESDTAGSYFNPTYAICKRVNQAERTYALFLASDSSNTADIGDGKPGRDISIIFLQANGGFLVFPERYTVQQGDNDWTFLDPGAFEVAEQTTRSGGVQSAQAYIGSAYENSPGGYDDLPEIVTMGITPGANQGDIIHTRRFNFGASNTPTIGLFYDNFSAYLYMFKMRDDTSTTFYLSKRTTTGSVTWQRFVTFAFPSGSYFQEFKPQAVAISDTVDVFAIASTYYYDSSDAVQANIYSLRFNQSGVLQDVSRLDHNNVATKRIYCLAYAEETPLSAGLPESVVITSFERNNFWGIAIFFGYFGGRASGDITQAELLTDILVDPGLGEPNYYFLAGGKTSALVLEVGGTFQGMRNIIATQDTRTLSIMRITSFWNYATIGSEVVYWDRQIRVKNTETGNFKFIKNVSITPDHRNSLNKHENYILTIVGYSMNETLVISLPVDGGRVGKFTTSGGKYEIYYEYATGSPWQTKEQEWSWTSLGTTGFTTSTPAPTITSPTLSAPLTTPLFGFKVIQ